MPSPAKLDSERIVDHAAAVLDDGGQDAVTMRRLARDLGAAPNALYWHFDNRDAILGAVAARGATDLIALLEQAANSGARDLRDLVSVAEAYLDFAAKRPHLYALLTTRRADPGPGLTVWAALLAMLEPLVPADRVAEIGVALWTYVHGAATLRNAGVFSDAKPEAAVLSGLIALVDGLKAGSTGAAPVDDAAHLLQ